MKRFLDKMQKAKGCWEWQAAKDKQGYGKFSYKGKDMLAHRASWMIYNGKIPDGICVLHKCDNPSCVNPKHLFLGTRKDNAKDMLNKGRSVRGEKHSASKLTEKEVLQIRKLYQRGKHGGMNSIKLANMFNTTHKTISLVVDRVNWRHV